MVAQTALPIDLSQYIETRYFDDRPHIRGRRIPISVIANTASSNQHGVPELMVDFDLTETEVLAALLYYVEHKAMIETQEAAIHEAYQDFPLK